jgi:hypothetical protein
LTVEILPVQRTEGLRTAKAETGGCMYSEGLLMMSA